MSSRPDTIASSGPVPPAQPGRPRLGWIGAGVMGRSMAGRLLHAGFPLTVFTRRQESAQDLVAYGAAWAASPAEVARQADIVFVMVGYPADVREVVLGAEGVLAGCRPGTILVDHTTSCPGLAVEPCWRFLAKAVVACGGPGTGQQTKLTNQIAIASGMIATCEALLYASRVGLDLDTTLQAISSGAAGSWSLTNLAPRILSGDFAPGFFVAHFVKDMRLALDECRRMNLRLPGLALAESLYARLAEQGHGRLGTQSLVLALAQLNGIEPPRRGS